VWLSVDPLSDKYPSLSPYNYCALNPVMLVDPDGKRIKPARASDKEKLNGYMNEQFGNVFYVNSSGWVQTNNREYRKLMKSNEVSQVTKDLARAFRSAVRSSKVAEVYIFSNPAEVQVLIDPKIRNEQTGKLESIFARSDGQPGILIKNVDGSITLSPEGWNTVIIIGRPDELYTSTCFDLSCPNVTSGYNANCQYTQESPSSIFLHEVLDHFFEEDVKGGLKNSSGTKWHNRALLNLNQERLRNENSHR